MAKGLMLYDVPLSNKYKDIPHFKSDMDVNTFLHDYQGFYLNNKEFNFSPFGSGDELVTQLVVDSVTYGITRKIIMNANYFVVTRSNEHEFFLPKLYYFITNIEWLGGRIVDGAEQGKVILHLELDVATTFKLCGKVTANEEVFTERRHTSRFVQVDEGYMFDDKEVLNGDPLDSQFQADIPEKPIYYSQDRPSTGQNVFYNLVEKFEWTVTVCKDKIDTGNGYIPFMKEYIKDTDGNYDIWTNLDISPTNECKELQITNNDKKTYCGVYLYLSPVYDDSKITTVPYSNTIFDNMFLVNTKVVKDSVATYYGCPVMEVDNEKYGSLILARFRIPINLVYQLIPLNSFTNSLVTLPNFSSTSQGEFTKQMATINEVGSYGTSIYPRPTFSFIGAPVVKSSEVRSKTYYSKTRDRYYNFYEMGLGCYMCINELNYDNKNFTYSNENDVAPFFETLPLVSSLKSQEYEPKLMVEPYATYTIKSKLGTPNGFTFNPLLLETDKMKVIFKYVPNVSTAKFSMFVKPYTDKQGIDEESVLSPYHNLYALNVGDINISDYTLPIKSDPFYQMALEQRNYRTTGLAVPVISSLTQSAGLIGATAMFNPEAMLSSVAGASVGVSSAISAVGNYYAHIDNLKNAPDSIRNSGNDALHDACLGQDLRPYLSVYRLKSAQRKQVFDYYYRMGYSVATYEEMSNWFVRQIFNYIKTNDDDLENKLTSSEVPLPSFIRRALADILNNGVTFWEMEQIDKFMSRKYENVEYADKIPTSRL